MALVCAALPIFANIAHAQSPAPAAVSAIGAGWAYRMPITLLNDGAELRSYQTRLELTAANFDFARAAPTGADLRFTDADGWSLLGHWVESYDPAAQRAVVWVKVWNFPAHSAKKLFLYYGNPSAQSDASGYRALEFFDDFRAQTPPGAPAYFGLSEPATALVKDQSWERSPPHTLSIVRRDADDFAYWGYYGLVECGGIGLARSNDLKTWVKYEANPLLTRGGERWPSVLRVGNAYYMIADRDYCGTSYLALRRSPDGLNWGGDADYVTLVKPEQGIKNQNANFFYDPVGGLYYLYWYRGGPSLQLWQIRARMAATPEGLADPSTERVILERDTEIAAPSLLYKDGSYFLATEVNDRGWMTLIFEGKTPLGPFEPVAGNPVMGDNQACFFQHEVDGVLVGALCKDMGPAGWQVNLRTARLDARATKRALDPSLWQAQGGWAVLADGAQAGEANARLVGSWADGDYTALARVRANTYPPGAQVWGLGVRADERGVAMYALRRVSRGGGVVGYLITKTDASGAQTVLADQRYREDILDGWCDAALSVQGSALLGRVVCDGAPVEIGALDPGAVLPPGRLALLGGESGGAQFGWAGMVKNQSGFVRWVAEPPQTSAGAPGAWLGIRATPPMRLAQHPPAHDAPAQAALAAGVIGLAMIVTIGVSVLRSKR